MPAHAMASRDPGSLVTSASSPLEPPTSTWPALPTEQNVGPATDTFHHSVGVLTYANKCVDSVRREDSETLPEDQSREERLIKRGFITRAMLLVLQDRSAGSGGSSAHRETRKVRRS